MFYEISVKKRNETIELKFKPLLKTKCCLEIKTNTAIPYREIRDIMKNRGIQKKK